MQESTKALIEQEKELVERYPEDQVVKVPDDGDYDHRLVKESLLVAFVCTRKTVEEAAAWLTEVRPPGTENGQWVPDLDHPQPEVPCADRPQTQHRHVAVNC